MLSVQFKSDTVSSALTAVIAGVLKYDWIHRICSNDKMLLINQEGPVINHTDTFCSSR